MMLPTSWGVYVLCLLFAFGAAIGLISGAIASLACVSRTRGLITAAILGGVSFDGAVFLDAYLRTRHWLAPIAESNEWFVTALVAAGTVPAVYQWFRLRQS